MSNISESMSQYENALKLGRKYYSACEARGQDPYPKVLNDIIDVSKVSNTQNLGLVDIPMDLIVGTWVEGRKTAFAGNFMPLLDFGTEFASKWVALCEAHLGMKGINDPIVCYEYLGKFYVQEGHKRVSVLKSYDAPSIPGLVTRILPAPSDDPEIQMYGEFTRFYKASRLYLVTFTKPGSYIKLQAAMGLEPDQVWSEDLRKEFTAEFRRFSAVFTQLNGEKLPITAGDALLVYLQVKPYAELKKLSADELRASLSAFWPDVKLASEGEPISVSSEPEQKEANLLTRIFGGTKVHAAFFYDHDPEKFSWPSGHYQGQLYLEEKLGSSVKISSCVCGDQPDADMEAAVKEGANVLFGTSPALIDSCRRIAAKYKNIAVYNCSLSMPYAGVRSYYCRIYEGKFITGAVAGAMAKDDRIGYIANYPIMGVTAAINAFALGARMTNPRAKIYLKWSCLPGRPAYELIKDGVSVISNRDEDGGTTSNVWSLGTYEVGEDGGSIPLASPRWNWGKFYEETVQAMINNGIVAVRDSQRAINDWWGLSSGVVDVVLDSQLPAGVTQLATYLKEGIIRETIDPFLCPIRDNQGTLISDGTRRFTPEELMRMDWLAENVEGSIPAFEDLLPGSQNLVRLLGIYRESIPPKTEDAVL